MKRLLSMVVAVAVIIVLAIAVAASGKRSATPAKGDRVITVIEHATTDTTTDTGAAGDSAGDVLTFANNVFDAADARKVGTDQGYCIRTVASVSYQCTWTTSLAGGQIVVAGPFYDAKDSNLAITGGTGRYRNVRGTMKLHARANGTKFAFAFHVIG